MTNVSSKIANSRILKPNSRKLLFFLHRPPQVSTLRQDFGHLAAGVRLGRLAFALAILVQRRSLGLGYPDAARFTQRVVEVMASRESLVETKFSNIGSASESL